MTSGRTTNVAVGSELFTVTTDVRAGVEPLIETLILREGLVVSRAVEDVRHLGPDFLQSEELRQRLETQHEGIVEKLQRGEIAIPAAHPALEERLQNALAALAGSSCEEAADELREILRIDPDFTEARELLEISYAARAGEKPTALSAADRVKAGAEAFAEGQTWKALEHWRAGVLADPASRLFHILVLIASTGVSPEATLRRKRYVDELLAIGQKYLSQNSAAEAYALFLIAQSAEAMTQGHEDTDPQGRTLAVKAPGAGNETILGAPPGEILLGERARPSPPPAETRVQPPSPATRPSERGGGLEPTLRPGGDSGRARQVAGPADTPLPPAPKAHVSEDTLFGEPPPESIGVPELFDATPLPPSVTTTRGVAATPTRPAGSERAATLPMKPIEDRRPRPVPRSARPSWVVVAGAGVVVLVVSGVFYLFLGMRGARPSSNGLAEADRLLTAGSYAEAEAAYSQVLAKDGDVPAAFLGRGRARLASGQEEPGLLDLERAAELAPGEVAVAEELAEALFDRGRFAQAVERYQAALERAGDKPELRFHLAASLFQVDRAAEALPHVEAALARNPNLGEARFLYARVLNSQGRHSEAEQELRKAESQLPPRGDFYAELGVALLEQGKVEHAETVARDFVRFDARDARSHCLLGEVFLRKKVFDAARDELITAIKTDPQEPRARIALGRTWLAMGEVRKAREALSAPLKLFEGDRLLALGQVSLAEGKPADAVALVEESLLKGAPPLPVRLTLAAARYRDKDLNGAVRELEQASKLAPSDPAIPLSLALVYADLKEAKLSTEQFLEALRQAGVAAPPAGTGPVMLPAPYVPVPAPIDLTKIIRAVYKQVLLTSPEDASGLALKMLAENASFVVGES